jgi:hypothetical protein
MLGAGLEAPGDEEQTAPQHCATGQGGHIRVSPTTRHRSSWLQAPENRTVATDTEIRVSSAYILCV